MKAKRKRFPARGASRRNKSERRDHNAQIEAVQLLFEFMDQRRPIEGRDES